jgi:hypothetical protein
MMYTGIGNYDWWEDERNKIELEQEENRGRPHVIKEDDNNEDGCANP